MRKIVFLTGGTGSFGRGFVRHALKDPDIAMVRVYSRDEHKQREMRAAIKSDRVSFFIGDVRDKERMLNAMEGSHWVIHAAALKQAPLGEIEPEEFIKTNIGGSSNVISCALALGVEKAILVSTDKAVEPINLYGATKMCAERLFIQGDACRGTRRTRFACTRYGNVAGTSGSIVPVLLSLKPGEPSVVYDPQATRFWIELEDANKFVLSSLKRMSGGEIFIPQLKSARVSDIIEAIRPGEPFICPGARTGDKRHEVLSYDPASNCRYTSDSSDMMSIEEIRESVKRTTNVLG